MYKRKEYDEFSLCGLNIKGIITLNVNNMHTLNKKWILYALHKKFPSNLMIEIGWKQKDGTRCII